MPIQGKVRLKSLIEAMARETQLNLLASPGSDAVFIYVSSSGISAGKLLKAVSLATCGTWRSLGSAHIFAVDKIGTLRFAAILASGLGYDSSGFPLEFVRDPWTSNGVVLDFTTAGKKKTDYLRIIEPPKSGSITGAQSP